MNEVYADPSISLKAKGVYYVLYSLIGSGQPASLENMLKRTSTGRAGLASALNELIAAGYAHRVQTNVGGRGHGFGPVVYRVGREA